MTKREPTYFTCGEGFVWEIDLTRDKKREVRKATGICESRLLDTEFLATWQDNLQAPIESLWVLCRKQAEDRGLDEKAFYASLIGHVSEAVAALVQAYSDRAAIHDHREFLAALAEAIRMESTAPMGTFVERQAAKVGQQLADAGVALNG